MLRRSTRKRIEKWVNRSLTDRCAIYKIGTTKTNMSAISKGLTLVLSDVPCRLIKPENRGGAQEVGMREGITETYRVILPQDTGVSAAYVLVIDGVNYQVEKVETRLTDEMFTAVNVIRER